MKLHGFALLPAALFALPVVAGSAIAPTAATLNADAITATGATLHGTATAGDAKTALAFDYGPLSGYGKSARATPNSIVGTTPTTAATSLGGLQCGTTYHFRLTAANRVATAKGADATFTTLACAAAAPPPPPPPAPPATAGSPSLRVSVSGFGYVTSDVGGLGCGSAPATVATSSTRCSAAVSGVVTLTATPYSADFAFAGWSGDAACSGPSCALSVDAPRWAKARFVPAASTTNACGALGLVSDKANHPLNGSFPALAAGQSFVDPNFGTTVRRVTDAANDGRGGTQLVPVYSTVSAWNADESYLLLYRVDGANAGHELYDGKTYKFIRALADLPYVDLEQVYWDTTRPNVLYAAKASSHVLYRYDVDAPAGSRLAVLHDFSALCGTKSLSGGTDPFFNSWDSSRFGFACVAGGAMFGYDTAADAAGAAAPSSEPRADSYGSPQPSASGRKLFLNAPKTWGSGNAVRLYDFNMVRGAFLDQASGAEHASTLLLSGGGDAYAAVQYDPGASGTGVGNLVMFDLERAPDSANRIPGRVVVGPSTGYPYPLAGHLGATAFHRTGLIALSLYASFTGATLLDDELVYVDGDAATNPSNAVCRVGHHRTSSSNYWAEPHAALSPSGTRILFGSSWGDASATPAVNAYVVELPGYRP